MALVSDIQLQSSAVKPPNLDTSQKFSAEGLTATTAFALTDAGAGTTVSTTGQFTAKSANDLTAWFQSTLTDGDAEIYISNDARPDWSLKVSGTAGDNFLISNSCSADGTIQGTALSITPAGAVGFGKYGATDALEINALNSVSAAIVIANATQGVSNRMKTESASGSFGTTTNHKIGFMTNATTRGVFDTSGNFGIGTDAPGALLDVRGSAIFNEAGAAVDFRIEGDTIPNLFLVDGSADKIGIGTATPTVTVDIDTGGDGSGLLMCVNGCICATGYMGEKRGHTIECAGTALTQRTGLNFVVTDVGTVVDDSSNDATVVCISGANTCVPFLLCDGSTSDPISLVGGSIGNALSNDSNPTLGGLMCGDGNNICAVCCICITGCYFGDGSNLTGVSSVPGCYSGDCTIIGCSAGGNVAAGATKIVLYGANAGYNVTTADNIVAIGSTVALCMTTATDQVIIGTNAGRCVLTCAGNVVVGAHAFYNECAGSFNTVIGNCAGLTQKGATTNTFIGALAGALDSTGSGNVFVGYKAGCANTTGSCCLIIGNGTCDLITGDFNTGIVSMNGLVGIGDTANACMTIGLTINQGANDNEILALKSSDVDHPFTTIAEADTYGFIQKSQATSGGFQIQAMKDADGGAGWAMYLQAALGENADTTKSTGATGIMVRNSRITNGSTGTAATNADGNLEVIQDNGTTRFIFDAEGTGHADVAWTTYSDERLKSNIKDLPAGIDTLMKLKPRIFDRQSGFISDGIDQHLDEIDNKVSYTDGEVVLEDNKRVQVGLVAQEAVDIVPEIVHNPPDKYSFYSMDYERLSVYNLAGIQDLKNEIDELGTRTGAAEGAIMTGHLSNLEKINALEKEVTTLKSQLN